MSNPISPSDWPVFSIPEDHWEPSGEEDGDPTSRLTAAALVNGIPMHFEAHVVEEIDGVQRAVGDYPEDLDSISQIANPDGPFYTVSIRGRDYVLLAYAFVN